MDPHRPSQNAASGAASWAPTVPAAVGWAGMVGGDTLGGAVAHQRSVDGRNRGVWYAVWHKTRVHAQGQVGARSDPWSRRMRDKYGLVRVGRSVFGLSLYVSMLPPGCERVYVRPRGGGGLTARPVSW